MWAPITRLEAFLDSLKMPGMAVQEERKPKTIVVTKDANHRKI